MILYTIKAATNVAKEIGFGSIAQLGERLPYKQDVGSSNLSSPTITWPRGVVVNMPACHAGDRRFKSDRGRHNLKIRVGGRVVKGGRL